MDEIDTCMWCDEPLGEEVRLHREGDCLYMFYHKKHCKANWLADRRHPSLPLLSKVIPLAVYADRSKT